ncbi:MAG: ribonuclease P protein component [Ruminococcaceae bacterium]|nr:ribonuclease P protein component [Oscillospiraceae bacterium]
MQVFEKLKQNYDFRRLYRKGKTFVTPYFVLYTHKGRKGKIRLGITAGKKLGCAVQRNRAKRVLYAAFSQSIKNITLGNDFVVVARTKILDVKSTVVKSVLMTQLEKAGLIIYETSVPANIGCCDETGQ